MNANQLSTLLASLTGQLHSNNSDDEKNIEQLQEALAGAMLTQDPATIAQPSFIFERSDLFISSNLKEGRLKKIKEIAELATENNALSEMQVFTRKLPIRTTQIAGGAHLLSAGARINTIGPIRDIHGQLHWFDFVKVKKLIALYRQGETLPALLFDATFSAPRFQLMNAKPIELTKTFNVDPESVWIQAKIFSSTAPADQYAGLRIKGGQISLDIDPFMEGNRLTISNACKVICEFQLEQNNVFATDPSTPFGKDARDAKFDMPINFKFSFTGNGKTIISIADAKWQLYGQDSSFKYIGNQQCIYNPAINRLAIPIDCNHSNFSVVNCQSPFFTLSGAAKIINSWWAIPVAKIDIVNPLEADGNGALIIECVEGLSAQWTGLKNKTLSFNNPFILGEPSRISITDLKSNGQGSQQSFEGWDYEKESIDQSGIVENAENSQLFNTNFECSFKKEAPFIYNTVAKGDEMIFGLNDWDIQADRPVKVNGEAVAIKTKGSAFILAVSKLKKLLFVFDENMLWDHKLPSEKIPKVRPIALAMHNALFTTTPPNSLVLFAECSDDLLKLEKGYMYLAFGLFSYLPTLPDPYAANLGILKRQFQLGNRANSVSDTGVVTETTKKGSRVWLWLIGLVKWEKKEETTKNIPDKVGVSFHFAPLAAPLKIEKQEKKSQDQADPQLVAITPREDVFSHLSIPAITPSVANNSVVANEFGANEFGANEFGAGVSMQMNVLSGLNLTDFSLLDVSSKANQMGISYAKENNFLQQIAIQKYDVNIHDEGNASIFPIQMVGLDVVTAGMNAQSFTVPAISWEPVFNLTPPQVELKNAPPQIVDVDGDPITGNRAYDPPMGFNYYANDGIATRIGNLSRKQVSLSPIPMAKFLVETYKNKEDGKTFALFNLPFGMIAITMLDHQSSQSKKPTINNPIPVFDKYIQGGVQLELTAGTSLGSEKEGDLFEGYTIQLLNVMEASGVNNQASTLAGSPTMIFNNEFQLDTGNLDGRPGVPLTHINLSGYGASTFSNWTNKEALFAQVSQAQFNVITGRTSHEVVQVKSMLYPWGIRVVRTITISRLANGYVARVDSGWKAESDGRFDFRWKKKGDANFREPYTFHPGIINGLFNIRNIKEINKYYKDGIIELTAVQFDADIQIENITEGGINNRVPSTGVFAYVQTGPPGRPLTENELGDLFEFENNSIGGQINCVIKIANSEQRMKINRFDMSFGSDENNKPIFVGAIRGSIVLPKDGSWTMVQHSRKTGEVSPLPEQMSIPLIRSGKLLFDVVTNYENNLTRLAHPADLLRTFNDDTIHFGVLQNMGTQKVLFMTPAFKKGISKLMSQTPPLLADSFRLLNSKAIFPNIGNLETNFGQAISLLKGVDNAGNAIAETFNKVASGEVNIDKVFEVLDIKANLEKEGGKLVDQGFELAKKGLNGIADKALKFDLPSGGYDLINLDKKLVIRLEYKASSEPKNKPLTNYVGKFDFNVDSFANDLAETWKGRMNNLAVVVSIGPLKEVMTIKGNFNSQKGKEVDLGSSQASDGASSLPTPEISFSDELQPVVDILEILSALSSGDYGDALKKGLKVAMSNSANIWEYKFEATKDIPLVKFPPGNLYNSPQTPLKLEASMSLGVYFNAALKVTTDPKQLLPTAGASFKFHGGLQVMCFSLAVGTIYAVGHIDLTLLVDSSGKVTTIMKFGFGVQLGVGLPVVGNVSVLFMVGLEIYADTTGKVKVTAFMLFKGQAELLGGLVCVTITIEASGTVIREPVPKGTPPKPANAIAKVTFAIDISIFLIIDISFSKSWEEQRQIA